MADYVAVHEAGLQVVYEPVSHVSCYDLGLMVVYTVSPELTGVEVDAAGVMVVYALRRPTYRAYPVAPRQRYGQSQGLARVFP